MCLETTRGEGCVWKRQAFEEVTRTVTYRKYQRVFRNDTWLKAVLRNDNLNTVFRNDNVVLERG